MGGRSGPTWPLGGPPNVPQGRALSRYTHPHSWPAQPSRRSGLGAKQLASGDQSERGGGRGERGPFLQVSLGTQVSVCVCVRVSGDTHTVR